MAEVIAYHEKFRDYVYSDSDVPPVPTVGYGLNVAASGPHNNKAFATKALAAAGLKYSDVMKSYNANPQSKTPVITPAQAWTVLLYTIYVKFNAAQGNYKSEFYKLDRDPQIALVDMKYQGVLSTPALRAEIQGSNSDNAGTNYTAAANDLSSISFQGDSGRQSDDMTLLMHGNYATTFTIAPIALDVGGTEALNVTANGAKGKPIILDPSAVTFSSSDDQTATVDGDGMVTGVASGTATVTETLNMDSSITAMGSVTVTGMPGTFNIPIDGGPVPLDGVAPGTAISVEIQYSTTDENENGEGESLLITNANGGTVANDATYNATSVYSYTTQAVTSNNQSSVDSLSAISQGWDGDESAVVTAYVQSTNSGLTPSQQAAVSTTSAGFDTSAAGAAAAANDFASDVPNVPGIASAATTNAVLSALASLDLDQLAVDPASPAYETIAKPAAPTRAIFSTAKSFVGVKNAKPLVSAINVVELNLEEIIDYASAAYTTENRLSGATSAKSTKWEKIQRCALTAYKFARPLSIGQAEADGA